MDIKIIINMKPKKELHIFDLDGTLWEIDNRVWIIDKEISHKPIIRLNRYEINKILNGYYIKDGLKIEYNGENYFISKQIYDKVLKKRKISINKLGLSWIEFKDNKYINNSVSKFLSNNIKHLRNKDAKIVILTGRNNQAKHADILNKLRKKLQDIGIEIYKIYFISDKFYNKHNEQISFDKTNIILEHLVGIKIDNNEFKPLKQDWYSNIYFYDDEKMNIDYAKNIQNIFNELLKKTDDNLFEIIKERINKYKLTLITNLVSNNETNLFETEKIQLKEPIKFPIKIEKHIKKFKTF